MADERMMPARSRRPRLADPGAGPLPSDRLRALTGRQIGEALGLLVLAFVLGVGAARLGGRAGWPRAGGYLGFLIIGTLLCYLLAVYAFQWTPRAAWRRAFAGALGITAAMAAVDAIKAALR